MNIKIPLRDLLASTRLKEYDVPIAREILAKRSKTVPLVNDVLPDARAMRKPAGAGAGASAGAEFRERGQAGPLPGGQ